MFNKDYSKSDDFLFFETIFLHVDWGWDTRLSCFNKGCWTLHVCVSCASLGGAKQWWQALTKWAHAIRQQYYIQQTVYTIVYNRGQKYKVTWHSRMLYNQSPWLGSLEDQVSKAIRFLHFFRLFLWLVEVVSAPAVLLHTTRWRRWAWTCIKYPSYWNILPLCCLIHSVPHECS